jgi:hypothetical protein
MTITSPAPPAYITAFWDQKVAVRDDPASVRIRGHHYHIGPETGGVWRKYPGRRGFNGRKFTIRFFDGRIVTTTNLWGQGRIPESHRERLPDNAEFVEERP